MYLLCLDGLLQKTMKQCLQYLKPEVGRYFFVEMYDATLETATNFVTVSLGSLAYFKHCQSAFLHFQHR
jgi:hypothetical protein